MNDTQCVEAPILLTRTKNRHKPEDKKKQKRTVDLRVSRFKGKFDGALLLETGEEASSLYRSVPARGYGVEGYFDLAVRLTGYPDQLFVHRVPFRGICLGGHGVRVENELVGNPEFLEAGGGDGGQYGGNHTCRLGFRNFPRTKDELGKFGAVGDGYMVVDSFEVTFLCT